MMNAQVIEGIMELLYLTAGGLVVGWVTSTFFARKAAIAEVSGYVMKRKLENYEELYRRLEMLTDQEILPAQLKDAALAMIAEHELEVKYVPQYPTMKIFGSAQILKDTYLDLDSFVASKRIYFSDALYDRMLQFTNYFAVLRRLQVLYEEQIINEGYVLDDQVVRSMENSLTLQLGLVFQYELAEEIKEVLYLLRSEINALELHKSGRKDHSNVKMGDDGPMMRKLMTTGLFKDREKVMALVTENVALAISQSRK